MSSSNTATRNVNATDQSRTIQGFTPEGDRIDLQELIITEYERGLTGTYLREAGESGEPQLIKANTGNWQFAVDFADVLQPLIDSGHTIKRINYSGGGTKMLAEINSPNPALFLDGIHWDEESWRNRLGRTTLPLLREAFQVIVNIGAQGRVDLNHGVDRLWCTNGAFSRFVNLGHFSVTQNKFDLEDFLDWVNRHTLPDYVRNMDTDNRVEDLIDPDDHELVQRGDVIEGVLRGQYRDTRGHMRGYNNSPFPIELSRFRGKLIGDCRAATNVANLLQEYLQRRLENRNEYTANVEYMPLHLQDMMKPFFRLPDWYIRELVGYDTDDGYHAGQLELAARAERQLWTGDVVNMVTSVHTINRLQEEPNAMLRIAENSDAAVNSIQQLISAESVRYN